MLARRHALAPVVLLSVLACEPPLVIEEHQRTSPDLVALETCDALASRLRENTRARYRTLARFRARQMIGDTTADVDIYDEPAPVRVAMGSDAHGGLPPTLVDGAGRLWVVRAGALEVYAPDATAAVVVDAVALEVVDAGLRLVEESEDAVRVLVVSTTGIVDGASGEPTGDREVPDEVVIPRTRRARTWWATLTDGPSGATLALQPIAEVDGQLRGVVVDDDGQAWLAVWFAPTLAVDATPSPLLPLGTVVAALEDKLLLIDAQVDGLTDDVFLPRVTVGDVERDGCADSWVADDGVGRGVLSLIRANSDGGVTVERLVTTVGAHLASDGGRIGVAEHADPAWWYWGAEAHPAATNLHLLDPATGAFVASHRVGGGLLSGGLTVVGGRLLLATSSAQLTAGSVESEIYDDSVWEEQVLAAVTEPAGAWPHQTRLTWLDDAEAPVTRSFAGDATRVLSGGRFGFVDIAAEQGGRLLRAAPDDVVVRGLSLPDVAPLFGAALGNEDVLLGGPRDWDVGVRVEARAFDTSGRAKGSVTLVPAAGWLLGDVWDGRAHAVADGRWALPTTWVDDNGVARVQVSVLEAGAGGLRHVGDGAVDSGPLDWADTPRVRGIAPYLGGWAVLERSQVVVLDGESLVERWRVRGAPMIE